MKKIWIGFAIGGAIIILVGIAFGSRYAPLEKNRYQQIVDEITSLEVSISTITPDYSGSKLAYVHSRERGRGLALINLNTSDREEIQTDNEVTQVYGWSPDERYLLFLQSVAKPKQAWITIYDSNDKSIRRLSTNEGVMESSFTFLTNSTYFFVSKPKGKEETYWGNLENGSLVKSSTYLKEDKFVSLSDKTAAFAYTANIYKFDVIPELEPGQAAPKITPVTKFNTNEFDSLQWLRYSRETEQYLFCARPTNSTWRYLFRYDPSEKQVTQLSHEDTYNGQFLQKGHGFVYVGNPNNSFYLAGRPENAAEHTNLFTKGSVVSYTASPDGNRIYVHGAVGDEPQGIWEYSLTTRSLRQVANGMKVPFVVSRVISPDEVAIESFDGLKVPTYFFTPPAVTDAKTNRAGFLSSLLPRKKYPAVIYIPPNSAQMQRSYGPRSQFLSNLGFYFLAVNYRGVDGYGKDYAGRYNASTAAKDILAAYSWLIKNPNIDKENIFIFSMSGGTPICMELLATAPELWRGMAIDKPSGMRIDPRFKPEGFPSLFLITGNKDPAMLSVREFSEWASENKINLKTAIYTNAAHITYDLNSRKLSQKQVADFYFENLK